VYLYIENMKRTFQIHLHCYNFPKTNFDDKGTIYLGVQQKKEIVMDTPTTIASKDFIVPIQVKPAKDGQPNFLGDFVHGKVGDRFLYLVWYRKNGVHKEGFRRAKIKLAPIIWEYIEKAIQFNKPIEAKINLTDNKGGPVCATLKPTNIEWAFL